MSPQRTYGLIVEATDGGKNIKIIPGISRNTNNPVFYHINVKLACNYSIKAKYIPCKYTA